LAAEWITPTEFARRVGVAQKNVLKAIANGRIEAGPNKKLDWKTQSIAWEENRDPSKEREIPSASSGSSQYAQVRAAQTAWSARMKQLQFEKASGKLIEKSLVVASIRKFSSHVRDSISQIPDRVSSHVTAEIESHFGKVLRKSLSKSDAEKLLKEIHSDVIYAIVHKAWDEESRALLEEMSNGQILES